MARIGLALDIDGVLVRGGTVIASAVATIQRIQQYKIPHIFVTNGGGLTEEVRAKDLSKKMCTNILPSQILLSHTPMRKLKEQYADKKILVIGSRSYLEVAEHYGFKNFVTAQQLHSEHPEIFPLRKPPAVAAGSNCSSNCTESGTSSEFHPGADIAAAMILHDPVDWALEMQVLADVLLGATHNTANMRQTVPLYACNADVVYMDTHKYPRFTQGAFTAAFKGLFEEYARSPLHIDFCGKPFGIQYRTAEEMLTRHAVEQLGAAPDAVPTLFYGIGDNPKADIRGANNAGSHWSSVLVRTGVFNGGDNDPVDVADIVAEDIAAAVDIIVAKHYSPDERPLPPPPVHTTV